MPTPILGAYFIVKLLKKSSSCPNNNGGVTNQTDEKHLNNMSEYFVGVVNIAFNRYNNHFVLCTHFDGYFGGHRDAAVLLRASPDDGGSPGLSYATKHRHRVSTRSDSINRSSQCCYVA